MLISICVAILQVIAISIELKIKGRIMGIQHCIYYANFHFYGPSGIMDNLKPYSAATT